MHISQMSIETNWEFTREIEKEKLKFYYIFELGIENKNSSLNSLYNML